MRADHDISGQFALDMQGFERLRHTARQDPEAAARSTAEQFEALFVKMMVKSMRDAMPGSALMNSRETDFYQSMLDQQWSQVVASRGMGLADALMAQLEGQGSLGASATNRADDLIAGIPQGIPEPFGHSRQAENNTVPPDRLFKAADTKPGQADSFLQALERVREQATPGTKASADSASGQALESQGSGGGKGDRVAQFAAGLQGPAMVVSRQSGIPADLMIAQAALETGWGARAITTSSGADSHNLFGIKAGRHWQGPTAEVATHEFIDGQRTAVTERFRVYDSRAEALADYARLVSDTPRYASVHDAQDARSAARSLQDSGYATDPDYANKLIAVMESLEQRGLSAAPSARLAGHDLQ